MAIVLSGSMNDITVNGVSVATDAEVSSAVASGVAPKANTADLKEIGVGQTWQDVTASRSPGVTYTNTTGKPISVSISIEAISNDVACTLTVQGVLTSSVYNAANGTLRMFLTCIVPSDGSYRVDKYGGGTYSIQYWVELR